ncbi:MAG: hypothetical protein FWD90_06565 [Defluviitaleaceae bacterium]|nr:hypothetical protein [Defluviitaleaceae bacterium]
MFDDEWINFTNFDGNYENYMKLFDPLIFDQILNSTIEQAAAVLAKITKNVDTLCGGM